MLLVIILVFTLFTLFTLCLTILITDAACDHPRLHLVLVSKIPSQHHQVSLIWSREYDDMTGSSGCLAFTNLFISYHHFSSGGWPSPTTTPSSSWIHLSSISLKYYLQCQLCFVFVFCLYLYLFFGLYFLYFLYFLKYSLYTLLNIFSSLYNHRLPNFC